MRRKALPANQETPPPLSHPGSGPFHALSRAEYTGDHTMKQHHLAPPAPRIPMCPTRRTRSLHSLRSYPPRPQPLVPQTPDRQTSTSSTLSTYYHPPALWLGPGFPDSVFQPLYYQWLTKNHPRKVRSKKALKRSKKASKWAKYRQKRSKTPPNWSRFRPTRPIPSSRISFVPLVKLCKWGHQLLIAY